jgi:hypothetical protein
MKKMIRGEKKTTATGFHIKKECGMEHNGKKTILLTAALVIALGPLFCGEVEITVEDTDLAMPLEGAVIRSWDGQEYTCDEAGKVLIAVPDNRPVVIQAAYPGYGNGRLIVRPGEDRLTLGLRLSGVMESRELVIEAVKPGVSETQPGRSVAVSEQEIARTGEIGIIEDVMTTIKLLPGVGYSGTFSALPSIRGGSPGDLMAVLDGFYIENPYHWGGGFSIFDPRMIRSAQLSHGVFSTRYGHSISGILDITSKKPSPTETELELGVSTSTTNLSLSLPLFGKGGIMVMGRVTYYDPVIWLAKQLAKSIEELEVVNYIRVAPYIRSGAFNANYRFTGNLELQASGFFGVDGVGVLFENESGEDRMTSRTDMSFDWENRLGFFTAGLTWNPINTMVLRALAGAGFQQQDLSGWINNDINVEYSPSFPAGLKGGKDSYSLTDRDNLMDGTSVTSNYQGRLDFDWDLGRDFVFALGAQELYSRWTGDQHASNWINVINPLTGMGVNRYMEINLDVDNQLYESSAYTLLEYARGDKKFGAELGLRLDHLYFIGRDFTLQTAPAWNPRLNLDFGVLQNRGPINALSLTLGAGLFSSRYDDIYGLDKGSGLGDFDLKPNRSATSILGVRVDFAGGLSFNIEGYYKYVFDRAYTSTGLSSSPGVSLVEQKLVFDGEGHVGGFDLQLQKMASRYWDGWISYSFNYARYRDPHAVPEGINLGDADRGNDWYYPSFHRFHTLNLVVNYKPVKRINIYTRFGLASGAPLNVLGDPQSIPVEKLDKEGNSYLPNEYIEIWTRNSRYSDTNRTTWSIPLDIKLSIFGFSRSGKSQYEVYVAVEGALSLLGAGKGNTSFNSYTGKEDSGSMSAVYEMPIPIPSFGFRWSY